MVSQPFQQPGVPFKILRDLCLYSLLDSSNVCLLDVFGRFSSFCFVICNPYDIKFNNGYYLLISYIICVSSRLLIGLVFTAIIFLDSKISNINNFQYQHSIFLLNTRRQNEHLNGYHLLVTDAVGLFDIAYQNLVSDTNMDDMDDDQVQKKTNM